MLEGYVAMCPFLPIGVSRVFTDTFDVGTQHSPKCVTLFNPCFSDIIASGMR
jgi:hypothetical protein